MNKKIKNLLKYLIILILGIFIGWCGNELFRFAEAMKNDKAPCFDSLKMEKSK